uniref:Receptor-transporting protein 3-like n=1 Tax=Geotrypetes seraphini TaxID=260995 RepID=A0A6P8SA65_GEOSA|nr:receptor-transporting protein 3-like [Geotrypetes seraphini]
MLELYRWNNIFFEEIRKVHQTDGWILEQEEQDLKWHQKIGWKSYIQHGAFARFDCSSCGHKWSSARVTIQFYMKKAIHEVKVRVFGQKCRKCCDQFEEPKFDLETSVRRILGNLVLSIRKQCYGQQIYNKPRSVNNGQHTEGPHERKLCEACKHHVCNVPVVPTSLLRGTETGGTVWGLIVSISLLVIMGTVLCYQWVSSREPTRDELLQQCAKGGRRVLGEIYSWVRSTINAFLHHLA